MKPVKPLPKEELFVAIPKGLPTGCGPAIHHEVNRYIESSPAGTTLTFFLADDQELLSTVTIPEGSKAYRGKIVKSGLAKVFDRLDPEKTGGSQSVDLLAIPSTIRKYRKRSDLKPRVILVGSPLIEDREQGNSIGKETIPCDGCVTDESTSYGKMASFPQGTTVSWLTPRADYGNGPNHREQVEHFLRYLLYKKGGPLVRLSSEAHVVFHGKESQWDAEVSPLDNCNGAKKVAEDKPKSILYAPDGTTKVIEFKPGLVAKVQHPKEDLLAGNKQSILFLIDVSGSVMEDHEGNDQSHLFRSIIDDVVRKLETMNCKQFAICGFGGWKDFKPRLPRYPNSVFSGFKWVEATPANRKKAIQFVNNLKAGGATPTGAAIEQALKLDGPMTCLLYSDGVPTIGKGGQKAVLELSEKLKKHKAVINTIGVGTLSAENEDFDWTGGQFLAEIARITGGEYFVIEQEKS